MAHDDPEALIVAPFFAPALVLVGLGPVPLGPGR
jgi:hypothetical protein